MSSACNFLSEMIKWQKINIQLQNPFLVAMRQISQFHACGGKISAKTLG